MTRLCTCSGSLKSTSELCKARNQLANLSCKTCGGSFLVNGIRSISGNMLSSVGLEVANSINPELSWKSVTKGRRSRKAVARSLNEGMKMVNRSPKRVGDFLGSDSDKIAEAGRWSSDKVEHVPIKKRRHLLRSSSPQSQVPSSDREEPLSPQSLPTPMPSEDCRQFPVHSHSSDYLSSDSYSSRLVLGFDRKAASKSGLKDKVVDSKTSEVANGKLYNSEDFSGIALLAAAACINGMDDDTDNGKGAHAVDAAAAPGGSAQCTASHSEKILGLKEEPSDPSRGNVMWASNIEESSTVDGSPVAPKGFADFDECSAEGNIVSPKVDRMHWDLNILMDAWEQPSEDSVTKNAFDGGLNDGAEKEKLKSEISDIKRDFEDKPSSGNCVPLDQNEAVSESANLKTEVRKPESLSVHDRISGDEILCGNPDRGCAKVMDSLFAQRKPYGGLASGDASLADSSFIKSHTACTLVSNGLIMTASDGGLIMSQTGDSSVKAAGITKAVSSEVPFLAKPRCESASRCKDSSDILRTNEVPDTSILNIMGVESSESCPTEAEYRFNPLRKCENPEREGQSVTAEPIEQPLSISAADPQMQLEGKDAISKFGESFTSSQLKNCTAIMKDSPRSTKDGLRTDDHSQLAKIASAFEDSHNSDISQEDRAQMNGLECMTRLDSGYDSPFEDGELRGGSIMYSWMDNEIEDGENECVDYESDGRDCVDSDAADHPASEIVEAGSDGSLSNEKRISSSSCFPEVEFAKGESQRNLSGRQFSKAGSSIGDSGHKTGLGTGSGSKTQWSSDMIEGNADVFRKGGTYERMAAFEFRGSYMDELGLRTNRGKLQSRIEGPLYLDSTDGKNATMKYQSRPQNLFGSYYRPEREVGPNKFVGRYRSGYVSRDRGARDGQWNGWNSRSCYPSAYNGSESQSYSRRRSNADSADKFGGLDSRDHRPSINYSSEGVRRPFVRRRSSVERDDYYDVQRRAGPFRGGYRSRGVGSFSQRFGRSSREEGYDTVPGNGDSSSARMPPQYLFRRERSSSPGSSRFARVSLPRRRSRSRSRTRSPHPWTTQRERNFSSRRHSKSPDLRPESRVERMRVPFRKPGFTSEYGEDFSPPPRGHYPPERSSRWIDERSFGGDHLRHKWSPMRAARRSQRFDPVVASGRLKPDEYRPMMRPGRFEYVAGTGSGGHKFQSNYDEKRCDDRHDVVHQIGDSDIAVGVRRFDPDRREGFEAGNSHTEEDIQSPDRRDVPRSAREDKRPLNKAAA